MDLDRLLEGQAAGSGVLGFANAAYFATYVARVRMRARKVAASSLVLVNAALGLEGAAFVVAGPTPHGGFEEAALVVARTSMLMGAAFVSLLIVRQHAARRRS